MTTYSRHDGVEFALQPYRELLSPKKNILLKKEIQLLAHNNGNYVRLFRQPDGQLEAIFSRDPGYLLGESVWNYFGQPDDMIYCEALPDHTSAILVIVRAGKVYLDVKLPLDKIVEELASLIIGQNYFCIYIYGNVPLADMPEEGKFVFDKNHVKTFNELDAPLFESLPVEDTMQLLIQEEAIAAQQLGNGSHPMALLLFTLLMLMIALGWYYNQQHLPTHPEKTKIDDPYQSLRPFLLTPAPAQQLHALMSNIQQIYTIPGWVATEVHFVNNHTMITFHSMGGTLALLNDWAKLHNAQLTITANGATVSETVYLKNRLQIPELPATSDLIIKIVDNMMLIIPNKSVTLSSGQRYPSFQATPLAITLTNVAPSILELIGQQLMNMPLQLINCDFSVQNGLLSGQIQLTLVGK